MHETTDDLFFQEAARIGDELLAQAEQDPHGLYWKTMHHDSHEAGITWQASETIYSGATGIVLFLLELYRHTHERRYYQAAAAGMHWVMHRCQQHSTSDYGLYTGHMGVVYALLQMARVTGHTCYTASALQLARRYTDFLEASIPVNDLLSGRAGTLLTLLHLHAATNEPWILKVIDQLSRRLIQNAQVSAYGLYWDRSPQIIQGLCGFSHGAAGIGFVFLEMGHYFQNEAFYWVAAQAFRHEAAFYSHEENNWADLRCGIYSQADYEQRKRDYLAGRLEPFTKGGYMNAWCHGAAGVGLARLLAYQRLGQAYEQEVYHAIKKTRKTSQRQHSACLCHGRSGNAELFLEAFCAFQDEQYYALAKEVASSLHALKRAGGTYISGHHLAHQQEDTSLFLGNAGVGYFFLRVFDPFTTPSILAPKLASSCAALSDLSDYPFLSASKTAIMSGLVQRVFPRTTSALKRFLPDQACRFLGEGEMDVVTAVKDALPQHVSIVSQGLPASQQQCLQAILALELEKVHLDHKITSYAYLYIRQRVHAAEAGILKQLDKTAFLKQVLIPDAYLKIFEFKQPCGLSADNDLTVSVGQSTGEKFVLLSAGVLGVDERPVSMLIYMIITAFTGGKVVETAVQEIINAMSLSLKEQEVTASLVLLEQVRHMIAGGLLIKAARPLPAAVTR